LKLARVENNHMTLDNIQVWTSNNETYVCSHTQDKENETSHPFQYPARHPHRTNIFMYKTPFPQLEYYKMKLCSLYLRAHKLIKNTPCVLLKWLVNRSAHLTQCVIYTVP